jgi:hypothetical protein
MDNDPNVDLLERQCKWIERLLRTRLYDTYMSYHAAREFAHDASKAFRREFEKSSEEDSGMNAERHSS